MFYLNNLETFYEGSISLWTGYFSSNVKKFGVLLKNDSTFYTTNATNIKNENPNNISPLSHLSDSKKTVLLRGWSSIDLNDVEIRASRGTETKFHLIS